MLGLAMVPGHHIVKLYIDQDNTNRKIINTGRSKCRGILSENVFMNIFPIKNNYYYYTYSAFFSHIYNNNPQL